MFYCELGTSTTGLHNELNNGLASHLMKTIEWHVLGWLRGRLAIVDRRHDLKWGGGEELIRSLRSSNENRTRPGKAAVSA